MWQPVVNRRRRPVARLLFGAALLTLTACGEQGMDVTARVTHDFNGEFELYSYPATPSKKLAQPEAIAKKAYGALAANVKSPQSIFQCVWRNPQLRWLDDGRPAQIFLACFFGPERVERPGSILELAEIYNRIDRANLKAMWTFDQGNYELTRFDVEIAAAGKAYLSTNLQTEIDQIEVLQEGMDFPQEKGAPFRFSLESRLPFRRNAGQPQSAPVVSLSFEGIAEPVPGWMNY